MADGQRALGVARQSTLGTAAATLYWLDFIKTFQLKPDIKYDIPTYLTNSPIDQRTANPTIRGGGITGTLDVDNTDLGFLLLSLMGLPTGPTSNVYTWLHGTLSPPVLTFVKLMGLPVFEQLIDAAITKLTLTLNGEQGSFGGAFDGMGTYSGPTTLTSREVASYTPPPIRPFMPWQTVLSRTAAGTTTNFCVVAATLTFERLYKPLYCTPTTAPGSTTPAGLAPSRQMQGPAHLTYEIIYEYLGTDYTGEKSSFYNYTRNLPEGWTLQAIDPSVHSPALGYTPTFKLEMPNLAGTDGELPIDQPGTMQKLTGTALYDGTTFASQARLKLTNELSSYPAS